MSLYSEVIDLYTTKDDQFKEELLHVLSKLVEEVSDLKGEVSSLQSQIDGLSLSIKHAN